MNTENSNLRKFSEKINEYMWIGAVLEVLLRGEVLKNIDGKTDLRAIAEKTDINVNILKKMLSIFEALGILKITDSIPIISENFDMDTAENMLVIADRNSGVRTQTSEFVKQGLKKNIELGWNHTNIELLELQGKLAGKPFVEFFAKNVLPKMGDLSRKLKEDNLHMLEVGSGTGQMSVALATQWPMLSITCLEPLKTSVNIASDRIRIHQLEERITILNKGIEKFVEKGNIFDAAWIASDFIPETILPNSIKQIYKTLRPGSWLWLLGINSSNPLTNTITSLRSSWWGGGSPNAEMLRTILEQAGYTNVQEASASSSRAFVHIIAQKPEA